MIKVFYTLMLTCFIFLTVNAQVSTEHMLDSIYDQADEAFELFNSSRYGEAIEKSSQVLEFSIMHNEKVLQARSYNVLGNSYYFIDKKDTLSFYYLFKAEELFEEIGHAGDIIMIYNDIGVNYEDYDNPKKSIEYYEKAVDLARKNELPDELVYPLFNIGDCLIYKSQQYEEAIPYLVESLTNALSTERFKESRIIAEIYGDLFYAHHKIGNEKEAFIHYEKSIALCEKYGFVQVSSIIYQRRAQLLEEDGKYRQALETYQKFKVNSDSLVTLQNFQKAKETEVLFKVKEKNQELARIQEEKARQARQIKQARLYNFFFIALILGLITSAYFAHVKNKQLKASKERAEHLSKSKSKFYSEISHELRTPLYAVIELSKLLLSENLNVKHKDYLKSLNFSGEYLLSLINNVLQYNKVDSGQLKIQYLELNLRSLISNIIESLEFALTDSGNEIEVIYDKKIPSELRGDSLKLSQIIINLVSNAIKFTKHGTITIHTKLIREDDDNVYIRLAVQDNGEGISEEKQEQIFKAFYQGQNISHHYIGTGLGLNIVKTLLNVLGSDIEIDSTKGRGSTFSFDLKLQKVIKNEAGITDYNILLSKLAETKVLVVDDNKINQLVTQKILTRSGICTEVVASGKEAIEVIKIKDFDCILMDIHMPGLNGYETTEIIRSFNEHIPIVALTAAATDEVEEKISEAQMDGCIFKPFMTEDFIRTIYKAINKQK